MKFIARITFITIAIRYKSKLKDGVKAFADNMKKEAVETKVAGALVTKHMKGEKLTPEEYETIREQFHDVLKMVGIGIPMAVIPGGTVLMPLLVKFASKHNIKLTPSSFDKNEPKEKAADI